MQQKSMRNKHMNLSATKTPSRAHADTHVTYTQAHILTVIVSFGFPEKGHAVMFSSEPGKLLAYMGAVRFQPHS